MRRAALVAAALAACGGETAIDLPPLEGQAAMILVAETARGTSAAAYAIAGGRPTKPVRLARSVTEPATLHIYTYAQALEALGLEEGNVELALEGTLSRALAPADRVFIAIDSGEGPLPWDDDRRASHTLWIAGVRAPAAPCPELRVIEHRLRRDTWLTLAVPIDSTSALVATERGGFYRVDSSTIARLHDIPDEVPHGAGFLDESGVLWLTGCEGQLARMYPREGFRVEMGEPCDMGSWLSGGSMIHLDGPREGPAGELFGVTRSGRFVRMIEGRTELLTDLAKTVYFHYVSWIGPHEAIMVTRTPAVVWAKDGRVDEVTPVWAEPTAPEITRAMHLEGRGVVLAAYDDRDGTRFTRKDPESGRWYVEGQIDFAARTYDFHPWRDGFAFTGGAGHAGVYTEATGFCATEITGFAFYYVLPVGERSLLLIAFEEAGNQDTDRVFWLEIID